MKYYTGIGSRNISEEEEFQLIYIGDYMARHGYTLRSGKARGADSAFADGAMNHDKSMVVNYVPWENFNINQPSPLDVEIDNLKQSLQSRCYSEAERLHPAWSKCSPAAKKLHARNMLQVTGHEEPKKLSTVLICCVDIDKNGDAIGGTRTAWMKAKSIGIPCLNIRGLSNDEAIIKLMSMLDWLNIFKD